MKTLKPNDLGKKLLVEDCHKISITDLLKICRTRLKKTYLKMEIEELGMEVGLTTSKTYFEGYRYWFTCPLCKKKKGVLFQHPTDHRIGCRTCLGLEYAKRRYKGMVESEYIVNHK